MKPRVLLLSGYDAVSHSYWRNLLRDRLGQYEWTQIALSPRHFAWRTRGSSATFAFHHREKLKQHYDLIVVTSMVDLASLRGFVPHLALIPTILYFHENQFVYPVSSAQPNIVNAQLTSVYSAMCADVVIFNSRYNLSSFFDGARALFKRLPEGIPQSLLNQLEESSVVIPVPIIMDNTKIVLPQDYWPKRRTVEIVWNHRWEYDKQPEVFFDAIGRLKKAGYHFKLHVLGQSFRQLPQCFDEAEMEFADEIKSWGYQPQQQYDAILSDADVVVSTALHDFQGLSMLQAIAKGCLPIAPNRVAYPEYVPPENLYSIDASSRNQTTLAQMEAEHLFVKMKGVLDGTRYQIPSIAAYSTQNLIQQYESLFSTTINL